MCCVIGVVLRDTEMLRVFGSLGEEREGSSLRRLRSLPAPVTERASVTVERVGSRVIELQCHLLDTSYGVWKTTILIGSY